PQRLDDLLIKHPAPACSDGTHRQFRLTGHPQFAHQKDIEWRLEREGHLVRDRHTPTRQSEHEHIWSAAVDHQYLGQSPACVGAILKSHHSYPLYKRARVSFAHDLYSCKSRAAYGGEIRTMEGEPAPLV